MANQLFQGFHHDDLGVAVQGSTVDLLDRNTTTPVRATTTTDVNGFWSISHGTEGRFDIRITSGSSVRWLKYDDAIQIEEAEFALLNMRNPANTFRYFIVPAAITANRTLNLPLITGTDTLAVLGLAQAFTTRQLWAKGADLASGTTVTPGTDGNYFDITGTTTITAIGSLQAGSVVIFHFDGILTLTHNATSLILQGATNLTTAAGDVVAFISRDGTNWEECWRRLAVAAADVSGPASATDNAIARFNGTAGKTIQDYTSGAPTISDDGIMLIPAQPAFLARNSTTDSNVTGNSTEATVDFDTEIFDQNADFASDTFTAPVTGRYLMTAFVTLSGITSAADEIFIKFVTSNRTYLLQDYILTDSLPTKWALNVSMVVDMDAADTITVLATVIGEASDVVDILGGTTQTMFSGCLLA